MESGNKKTRKCPHCGKWSVWNMNVTDRCDFCDELLDPAGFARQEKNIARQEANKNKFTIGLVEINPEDGAVTIFFKKIVRALQISFMAFMSFILWLIAMLAG